MEMGTGMAWWEWEEWKLHIFPFPVRGREPAHRNGNESLVSDATSASPGTSAYSDALDCHSPPAKKHRVFDFKDLCDPEDDQQQNRNELA